jgi:hypothetical protein
VRFACDAQLIACRRVRGAHAVGGMHHGMPGPRSGHGGPDPGHPSGNDARQACEITRADGWHCGRNDARGSCRPKNTSYSRSGCRATMRCCATRAGGICRPCRGLRRWRSPEHESAGVGVVYEVEGERVVSAIVCWGAVRRARGPIAGWIGDGRNDARGLATPWADQIPTHRPKRRQDGAPERAGPPPIDRSDRTDEIASSFSACAPRWRCRNSRANVGEH